MRDQAYEFYYKTPLEMCCTRCCVCCIDKSKHYLNGNLVKLEYAPNPSNIHWTNLGVGNASLAIRYRISWGIFFVLLVFALFF